jgi:hypothetical protein
MLIAGTHWLHLRLLFSAHLWLDAPEILQLVPSIFHKRKQSQKSCKICLQFQLNSKPSLTGPALGEEDPLGDGGPLGVVGQGFELEGPPGAKGKKSH